MPFGTFSAKMRAVRPSGTTAKMRAVRPSGTSRSSSEWKRPWPAKWLQNDSKRGTRQVWRNLDSFTTFIFTEKETQMCGSTDSNFPGQRLTTETRNFSLLFLHHFTFKFYLICMWFLHRSLSVEIVWKILEPLNTKTWQEGLLYFKRALSW